MELKEGPIIYKNGKQSRHCTQKTLLPYDFE